MSQPENPYADEYNPFAAPTSPFDPDGLGDTNAEVIRRAHLSHEASVKSVGSLYLIGGVSCVVASIGVLIAVLNGAVGPIGDMTMLVVLSVVGIAQCVTAFGLRGLHGWARVPTGLLSGIGLISVPIGTIVNGYILYLIFCAKGSMVFSDEYHRIIEATPHIKYKTSIIVQIFLFLLLILIVMGILGIFVIG